jgi:hypothetical protein
MRVTKAKKNIFSKDKKNKKKKQKQNKTKQDILDELQPAAGQLGHVCTILKMIDA